MGDLKIKALVVDDLDYIRESITELLTEMGISNIHEASDGEEAIEKIFLEYEGGTPFQIILCDIHMPKCDGMGLLERVRSDNRFEKLPILIISSESDANMIKKAILLGADSYLLKPFTNENLERKIHGLLGIEEATYS